MDINASTKLYCIFGSPVQHSLSPVMHNCAFSALGINAVYLAFEPTSAGDAAAALRHLGIAGASVTIPFKIDMLRHMDECDPLATLIGSMNTIVNDGGRLIAYNTDGIGALRSLEEKKVAIAGKSALIIGNGGSARAIAFSLVDAGARVIIAGRNREKIDELARDIRAYRNAVESVPLGGLTDALMHEVSIVINTTPLGMAPDIHACPLKPDLLKEHHAVFDIVYHPDQTVLLAEAQTRGCIVIRGVAMLLHQGVLQFELWTGRSAPIDQMRQAVEKHLYGRSSG